MHENFYHNVKVYYEDTDAGGIVITPINQMIYIFII